MLHVNKLVNPLFSSCTYVVSCDQSREAVVIDPGIPDISDIIDLFAGAEIETVPFIILTHEHFDHIAGVEPLRKQFGSRLVCSLPCASAIRDSKANMSFYKDGKGMVCGPADWVCERDGWELRCLKESIRLLQTPGHSMGGICVAIGDFLFTGDTLLGNCRTPTHIPGGDKEALKQSVTRLRNEFLPTMTVYPGHGLPFQLGEIVVQQVLGR